MGKQDEYVLKKKSKVIRKRLRKDGGDAAHSRHGLEAARRRSKAGFRRICEGMCYTLPTPEDPFNERGEKTKGGKTRKRAFPVAVENIRSPLKIPNSVAGSTHVFQQERKNVEKKMSNANKRSHAQQKHDSLQSNEAKKVKGNTNVDPLTNMEQRNGYPLSMQRYDASGAALNGTPYFAYSSEKGSFATGAMEVPIPLQGIYSTSMTVQVAEIAKRLTVSLGGVIENLGVANGESRAGTFFQKQCWEACEARFNVLGLCRDVIERRLSYVPAAVSHLAHRDVLQNPDKNPVVLILVNSQEEALSVRRCFLQYKKDWNIHSVCLHTRTKIERQVEGLGLRMPEVIVATPDRLSDLLTRNLISLLSISFMVIDSLEDMIVHGFAEQLIFIRSKLKTETQTFVFSDGYSMRAVKAVQHIVKDPVLRVSLEQSIPFQSACISQDISVVVSNEKKISKLCRILKDKVEVEGCSRSSGGTLVLVQTKEMASHMAGVLKSKGFSVELFSNEQEKHLSSAKAVLERLRSGELQVVLKDMAGKMDLSSVRNIVFYDFPSIQGYVETLTTMAQHSTYGELHSICTSSMAPLALGLIEVLQNCCQPVPKALQMLADAYSCLHLNRV